MTLFWNRFWAFLKSVPAAVWATGAALLTIMILYLQRLAAENREQEAKQDADLADGKRRAAEARNTGLEHKVKARVAVQAADKSSKAREETKAVTVKALERLEDMSDSEITDMMLRDAQEEAKAKKVKK